MERIADPKVGVGTLLAAVGALGAGAGTVVLYAFDGLAVLQAWLDEAASLVPRLVSAGQVPDVQILIAGLLAVGGGLVLLAAGALVVLIERSRKASGRTARTSPRSESAPAG